jgi:hypothetical protein
MRRNVTCILPISAKARQSHCMNYVSQPSLLAVLDFTSDIFIFVSMCVVTLWTVSETKALYSGEVILT